MEKIVNNGVVIGMSLKPDISGIIISKAIPQITGRVRPEAKRRACLFFKLRVLVLKKQSQSKPNMTRAPILTQSRIQIVTIVGSGFAIQYSQSDLQSYVYLIWPQ